MPDPNPLDHLIPICYEELHRIAEAFLRREQQGHTLQATALIHEAYLRMAEYGPAAYDSRAHFFGVAARVMRQVLVDYARARRAAKRSGTARVAAARYAGAGAEHRLAALDDALSKLALEDGRKAHFVELRFFGGMTAEEIASVSGIPVHVVRRELRFAQAWLRREISGEAKARGPSAEGRAAE